MTISVIERHCPACDTQKPISDFGRNRARSDGLAFYCRACARVKNRAWAASNPNHREKNRARLADLYRDDPRRYLDYRYRSLFGIGLDVYEDMLAEQGGGCAICGHVPTADEPRLAVDHDHACCPTPKKSCGRCVRGLLCASCNHGLGRFRDRPDLLRRAAEYLQAQKERA